MCGGGADEHHLLDGTGSSCEPFVGVFLGVQPGRYKEYPVLLGELSGEYRRLSSVVDVRMNDGNRQEYQWEYLRGFAFRTGESEGLTERRSPRLMLSRYVAVDG